jgi:hypothetical protein
MKYTKRLIAAVVLVAGIGTTAALTPRSSVSSPAVVKSSLVQPSTTSTDTAVTNAPAAQASDIPAANQNVTAPTPVTAPPAQSQAEQNRANMKITVYESAKTTLAGLNKTDNGFFGDVQWACVDKLISGNQGYENYDALLKDSAYTVLIPKHNDDGTTSYNYFEDPTTCRVHYSEPV